VKQALSCDSFGFVVPTVNSLELFRGLPNAQLSIFPNADTAAFLVSPRIRLAGLGIPAQ
jgi:hypothetical protein